MPPLSCKTEKPKNTKKTLRRIGSYLVSRRWLVVFGVILALLGNACALIGPRVSGKAIDLIDFGVGKVDFNGVIQYIIQLIFLYLVSAIMTYMLSVLMIRVGRSISEQMRQEVFEKLMKLPVGYFDSNQTGDLISRMSYDIDVINTSLSADVVQIVTSIITIVGSFIMMLVISPPLIIVVLITLPLSIIYTAKMTKKTRPLFRARSKKYGALNGFSEEMFTGQKTIQCYAREKDKEECFQTINQAAAEAYYNADYYGTIIGPSVGFINNLSLSFVAILGAILYLYQLISIGQISSFVLYSRKFSGPVNEIANMYNELMSALAAAERVFSLLNEDEEPQDCDNAIELQVVEGRIEFDHVTFYYTKGRTVIKDMSFVAEPGQVVAIVGKTGVGKTTIINLLMRFYDVCGGTIRVDGRDIREYSRKSLRQAYTMVLQETWLFQGTIRENIAYGKRDATMEEVIKAAKDAGIHSYIMTLPEGYETIIYEDGGNVSKGQKQLLTIARSMLSNSNMLILDEATSNVDTRTEKRIQKAMLTLMSGRTTFVIAHRLSTIQNADRILVMEQGEIRECGTHKELMDCRGYYYDMYASQYR